MRIHDGTLLTLLLLLVAGCAVPNRDNPQDPVNAPVASARIIGIPKTPGVACPTPDAATWPEVLAGSRGMCLAIDATGSTDPDDDLADLSFELAFVEPCDGGSAFLSTASLFLLPRERLRACPVAVPIEFDVTVRDPDAGTSRARARLALQNARPVARVNPPRTLPVGGFDWAPGADFIIRYSGAGSVDPDDDDLFYQLTLSDGTTLPLQSDPDAALFTETVPATAGVRRATLRVYDGDPDDPATLVSSPVASVVYIREPNVWALSESRTQVIRVDSVYRELPAPFTSLGPAASLGAADDGEIRVLATNYESGERLGVITVPGYSVQDLMPMKDVQAVLYEEAANQAWILVGGTSGEPGCPTPSPSQSGANVFTVLRLDAGTFAQAGCQLAVPAEQLADTFVLSALDGAGRLYFGSFLFSRQLTVVERPNVVHTSVEDGEHALFALSARPGTSEMWSLWGPDIFAGSTAGGAVLTRHVSPTEPPERFQLGSGIFAGFAWADETRFWVFDPARGLVLADADLLVPDVPDALAPATILVAPDVFEGFVTRVEPSSGTAWTSDLPGNVLYRATVNGDVTAFEPPEMEIRLIDPSGGLWIDLVDKSARALVPDDDSVPLIQPTLTITRGAIMDPQTGGVWIANPLASRLSLMAEDGSVAKASSQIVLDGQERAIAFLQHLSMSPNATYLYALDSEGTGEVAAAVLKLDVSRTPPVGNRIADATLANQILDQGGSLSIAPSFGGAPARLWAVAGATVPEVVQLATDGTGGTTTRYIVPGAEWTQDGVAVGAPAWDADRFCFGYHDSFNNTFHLLSVPGAGPVPAATSYVPPAGTSLLGTGASPGMCWMWGSGGSETQVIGIDGSGTITRTHTLAGLRASVLPVSADEFWAIVERTTDNWFLVRLRRVAGTFEEVAVQPLHTRMEFQLGRTMGSEDN